MSWAEHELCGPLPHPDRFWGPEQFDPTAWRTFAAGLDVRAEIAAILEALGDAHEVVDVGGGTGTLAQEIAKTRVLVVMEPSAAQRKHMPKGVLQLPGRAEALKQDTRGVDATMATWVLQYTSDPDLAVSELARVARRTVVIVQAAPGNELVDIYNAEADVAGVPRAHHGYLLARAATRLEASGYAVTMERIPIPLRAPPAEVVARLHFAKHPELAAITEATRAAIAGREVLADDGVLLVGRRR